MDTNRMTSEERNAASKIEEELLELITDSIVAHYDCDLERWDDLKDGGFLYTPFDTDRVRELLTELWSELAAPAILDRVLDDLTAHGAPGPWPRAWCDEDDEETEAARIRDQDADEAAREAHGDRR